MWGPMWERACPRDGLTADVDLTVGAGLPAMTAYQPTPISLTPRNQIVGAGLPAMTACQPTPISLTPRNQTVGAGLLAKTA